MPHKSPFFILLFLNLELFWYIELTFNIEFVPNNYQNLLFPVLYVSSVKKTDKKIICEDQEHISNNRGCYLKVRL